MTLQTVVPQNSAGVDGGLSGGSSMLRPGSDDPNRHQQNFAKLSPSSSSTKLAELSFNFAISSRPAGQTSSEISGNEQNLTK